MKSLTPLLLCVVIPATQAYEPERATNNFGHEAAECAAYFLLASTAPNLDATTVAGLHQRFEQLLEISVVSTTPELTKARVQLATETMKREMKGNWSNFSIINQKYGYKCLDLSNDPDSRARYWRQKKG